MMIINRLKVVFRSLLYSVLDVGNGVWLKKAGRVVGY
jgi:hypothetical protein